MPFLLPFLFDVKFAGQWIKRNCLDMKKTREEEFTTEFFLSVGAGLWGHFPAKKILNFGHVDGQAMKREKKGRDLNVRASLKVTFKCSLTNKLSQTNTCFSFPNLRSLFIKRVFSSRAVNNCITNLFYADGKTRASDQCVINFFASQEAKVRFCMTLQDFYGLRVRHDGYYEVQSKNEDH